MKSPARTVTISSLTLTALQFSDQSVDITPYAQVLTAEAGVLRITLPKTRPLWLKHQLAQDR